MPRATYLRTEKYLRLHLLAVFVFTNPLYKTLLGHVLSSYVWSSYVPFFLNSLEVPVNISVNLKYVTRGCVLMHVRSFVISLEATV